MSLRIWRLRRDRDWVRLARDLMVVLGCLVVYLYGMGFALEDQCCSRSGCIIKSHVYD